MQQRSSGSFRPRLFRCAPSALFRCAPSALFRRAAILLICGVGTVIACYGPTELTLALSTDASCGVVQANGIAISVSDSAGALGAAPPVATSFTCEQGPDPNLGTLVLTPSAGAEQVVVQVVLGIDRSTTDCQPPAKVDGCIVARRRVTYQRHRSLRVPIRLDLSCKGVPCGVDDTCDRGRCVPSLVPACEEGECLLDEEPGAPAVEAGATEGGVLPDGAGLDAAATDGPRDAPNLLDAITSDGPEPFCPDAPPPPPACAQCAASQECCIRTIQTGGVVCVTKGSCAAVGASPSLHCTEACQCVGQATCSRGPGLECPVKMCGGTCNSAM